MPDAAVARVCVDGAKEDLPDAKLPCDTQNSSDQLHSKIQMEPDTESSKEPLDSPAVDALYRRILWRLMPLFCLMVIFNHIDRSNLSFASLQFNADLGFTAQQYSTGGALFFVGFLTFMVSPKSSARANAAGCRVTGHVLPITLCMVRCLAAAPTQMLGTAVLVVW
jgi:hypothetical protein